MSEQFSQSGDSSRQGGRRERTSKPYQGRPSSAGNKERVYSSREAIERDNNRNLNNPEGVTRRPRVGDDEARPRHLADRTSSYGDNRDSQRPRSSYSGGSDSRSNSDRPYRATDRDSRPSYDRERPSFDRDARSSYPSSNRDTSAYTSSGFNRDNQSDYRQRPPREGGYRPNNREDGNRGGGGYRDNSNREGGYRGGNRDGQAGGNRGFNRSTTPNRDGGNRNFGQGGRNNDRRNDRPNFRGPNDRPRPNNRGGDFKPRTENVEFRNKPVAAPIPEYMEHWESSFKSDEQVRLNKYIANTGLCSRREADDFIKAGQVTVNGVVVSELGSKILPTDEIRFNGELLKEERKVYILLNKPKDFVTTLDDPNARKTVVDLIKGACRERIYPVGRLDRQTTGVLLLTNDGEMTKMLTHPKYEKKKIYEVALDNKITREDMVKILEGFDLEDGFIKADNLDYSREDDPRMVGIEIHSGKNRVVRRIFEHVGYKVTKLDRVYFAGLTKKGLQRGQWRFLTDKEVNMLKMGAYA
jgi:23S rRNA pseudouridine2605 synthase